MRRATARPTAPSLPIWPIHIELGDTLYWVALGVVGKQMVNYIIAMTTTSIDIRRASPSDAVGISKVHDASWRSSYGGLIPHRALETLVGRRDTQWWSRAIQRSSRILVLEAFGDIVGYATLGHNRTAKLPEQGEVYELYLLPTYQGLGFGKRLFLAARQELVNLGMRDCVVWALRDNHQAVDFYHKAGGKLVAQGDETFDGTTLEKYAFSWSRFS